MSQATSRPRSAPTTAARRRHAGQSVVEFALVVPILLLMVVAISDFGRLYTSAVAVESAAREAADYGSFGASKWNDSLGNVAITLAEMERRACVAAAGSHLQDYVTSDPANNSTCSNPTFTCTLEWQGASSSCGSSTGFVSGVDCSDPATDPACIVHVRLDYDFHTLLGIPPFPEVLHIGRDSYFRVSELAPVPAP